ncbi:MAG: hypothetical protein ABSA13_11765 [Beijerinckiaceae bacterium]|jgi:hypothetical protein
MNVPRILLVGQDKGGVGKSTAVRALAEAVPGVEILEIDVSPRLVEYDIGKPKTAQRQVKFFPMRADRAAIERTGGKAARAEFDDVINAIVQASSPTIVDIGANTSTSFLVLLADLASQLKAAGVQLGALIVVTAEPGAMAEAPKLLALAKPFIDDLFLLENQMRGTIDPKQITAMAQGAKVSLFGEQVMEAKAVEILQDRGLLNIPNIDSAALNKTHGLALGARIRRDLLRFRLEAMQSVHEPANWLVN